MSPPTRTSRTCSTSATRRSPVIPHSRRTSAPDCASGSAVSKKRVVVSWSSGKDSAWTLYRLRQRDDIEVVGLMTTLNQAFDRVAMHSTRAQVLGAQAAAAGLPLRKISLPWPCSNEQYEAIMRE